MSVFESGSKCHSYNKRIGFACGACARVLGIGMFLATGCLLCALQGSMHAILFGSLMKILVPRITLYGVDSMVKIERYHIIIIISIRAMLPLPLLVVFVLLVLSMPFLSLLLLVPLPILPLLPLPVTQSPSLLVSLLLRLVLSIILLLSSYILSLVLVVLPVL